MKINGKQTVKLKSGGIKSKNYFKQLALPFKIYADFESLLKRVQSNARNNNTSCSFSYKVAYIDDKFSKPVVIYIGKNAVNKFIEAILKEMNYCKKIIKKLFNKIFVMSAEDEERLQSSNKF